MKVSVIRQKGTYIFIGLFLSLSDGNRVQKEHEAGIDLLKYGMKKMGFPEQEIVISSSGKPYFSMKDKSVYFNISHSAPYVVCAISDREIGCDIEKIKRIPRLLDGELRKLDSLPVKRICESDDAFQVQKWTIYESIGKCIGTGIPVDEQLITENNWNISSWLVGTSHILSIAACDT